MRPGYLFNCRIRRRERVDGAPKSLKHEMDDGHFRIRGI
jgi:hypothetical protein